jgi:CheY-like chemotaxis protein
MDRERRQHGGLSFEEATMSARILLVDDEAAIRRQVSVGMAQYGIETRESGDGLSALYAIDKQARTGRPFQVVITDMRLPDIDGLKLLSLIKSRYPDLPVILISGYGTEGTSEQVTERRGDAFVPKPFAMEELAKLVDELAEEHRPEPEAETRPQTSAAAYAFVQLDRTAEPWKVLGELAYGPNVLYCDPVRDGKYDLVLLLHGSSAEEIEQRARAELATRPGVAAWELLPVAPPFLAEEIRSFMEHYGREHAGQQEIRRTPNRATSYVLVDANPPDLTNLFVRLYFLDEVVEIDASAKDSRLVLLLQGSDFGQIRRVIAERIRTMEGVARVHELKVIPFEQE